MNVVRLLDILHMPCPWTAEVMQTLNAYCSTSYMFNIV